MGRDLSKRHSSLYKKTNLVNPFYIFPFIYDVFKTGKSREIVSFIVWEAFHKLGLFPKKQYIEFTNSDVLILENENLKDLGFKKKIIHFFTPRGISITNSVHNWKLIFITKDKEIFGSLFPDGKNLYKSTDGGNTIILINKFPNIIMSIFVSSQNTIFVCLRGTVYKSSDGGGTFKKSLDLGSSVSFIRHNRAVTETPSKTIIMGEYGNVWEKSKWRKLAYLYFSSDNGETWERSDFLINKGINKHVHIVKYSSLLNRIIVADGDNKKKLWVSESLNSNDTKNLKWQLINRFHIQMGGYTAIAESDGKILFGTDYQGGTNFIVETSDCEKFTKKIVPDPYRRSPITNMIARKSKNGNEIWANLHFSIPGTKCLLMYTKNGGKSWSKVIEYSRATHQVRLINSSNETSDVLYLSIENRENKDRVVYKVVD